MKPTKRKAFNFLRSYFDVLNQLENDNDKLDFLLSIINKQFLDEDPVNLSFVSKLCYESQRHAIEKSVKGYKDKTKQDMLGNPIKQGIEDPMQDPTQGGRQDPIQQEKEKEEVKEKEEEKVKQNILYNVDILLGFYLKDDKIVNAVISNKKNKIKDYDFLVSRLNQFNDMLKEIGCNKKEFLDYCSHFRNWNSKQKEIQTGKQNFTHKGFSL